MICSRLSSVRRAQRIPQHRFQGGVGLIEVMIAVLVLSIGFLGVGALLAMSLSTNNSAMSRSLATVDSYTILDAMRADIANAQAGSYNGTVVANNCPSAGTTLASWQLNTWCTQLGHDLGADANTSGTVTCSKLGDCKITIQFDDSRAGVGGTDKQQVITRAIL
ncbi:type IV pilus modification protein PilV [Oleiagrimonas sp. MCCC 1A03011]|uniref:type IV pilus modification protein PilV n=1 Tax=Oleiagrimonas sp. MCCC 1A03011 TaxID=1926883 RepID=UPI000DC311EC|nr:type IV pilus modification protein PilV [Oleiagrimonas sp. MCCC 1A03011]RAP56311.1 type IV pilus modification protein PilV [Oleiagrimonas sp. MCCC 1A03011]